MDRMNQGLELEKGNENDEAKDDNAKDQNANEEAKDEDEIDLCF